MKNEDHDHAKRQARLITGVSQLAQIVADWSHDCAKILLKSIGRGSHDVTQEFIDTFLQFASFFQYSINLKLFQELNQEEYEDVSEGIIGIFSRTFVRVFYSETRDSATDAMSAYADEINSFVHNLIGWYVEELMSERSDNVDRFLMSVSLLSSSVRKKLGLQHSGELDKEVLGIVMKVMDTEKIDEQIAMLAIDGSH